MTRPTRLDINLRIMAAGNLAAIVGTVNVPAALVLAPILGYLGVDSLYWKRSTKRDLRVGTDPAVDMNRAHDCADSLAADTSGGSVSGQVAI